MKKILIVRLIRAFLFFLLGGIGASHAGISIDQSIVYFESGIPGREDVTVHNTGDKTAYIKITSYQIDNPGTDNQSRTKVTDPRGAGLLVSPAKLAIAPGGRKLVRFVNLKAERSEEEIYRVLIEPVSGPVEATQTGLMLLVGYEVLVIAGPESNGKGLEATRVGQTLHLENKGNVNLYLRGGKQCRSLEDPKAPCHLLRDKRLYPGNIYTLNLQEDWPVEFQVAQGTKTVVKQIP